MSFFPESALYEASKLILGGYLWIILGSSLQVMPAANFPYQAYLNGSPIVIVNRDPTYLDVHAEIIFREDIVEVLKALEEELYAQGYLS